MYDFAYHRPKSLNEALNALKGKSEARPMSGGMTLIPTLKQRLAKPSDVVDLGAIKELAGIKVEGNNVVIGGMTRHADVAGSADVKSNIPALAHLAGHIGDPQVRNRGTIGGSIANNDPAADYPAAVVALGATVTTNTRKIAADDFFKGLFETALGDGELVTSVSFPKAEKAAYMKFPNPASRYAMVGVFVAKTGSGVRVAVTGAGPCVFRVKAMEDALARSFTSDAIKDIKIPADGLNSDIHASAEYRAHLVGVMARRAVDAANK
jgi:carbon-monoxide dehydrogenase medium subunit